MYGFGGTVAAAPLPVASICGEDWGAQTPFLDIPFLLRLPSPPLPLPLEIGPLKCSQGVRGSL